MLQAELAEATPDNPVRTPNKPDTHPLSDNRADACPDPTTGFALPARG
jgi:hypothetical protein